MDLRPCLVPPILAALAGCANLPIADSDRPEMAYLPPSGPPAAIPSAYVGQPPFLVFGNILDRLQQQGLEIRRLREAEGRIIVGYHGDPESFVDCGWIVTYDDDGLDRVPAARADATFERRRGGRIVDVDRRLDLDAEMVVEVEPRGDATVVSTATDYALTKTATSPTGAPLDEETVTFASGEAGSFAAGTTCQSTGTLERLVLDALPAVALAGR
jgi:hypothetical protein